MGPWEKSVSDGALALVILFVFVLLVLQRKASRAFLRGVAETAGWTEIKTGLMPFGVKGMWRRLPARFSISSGGEHKPAHMTLVVNAPAAVTAQSAALLRVTCKSSFFSSSIKLLGPMTDIDLGETTSGFRVRGDRTLAVRVFSNPSVAKLIDTNVVGGYDELLVHARGCRIRCGFHSNGMISKQSLDAKYGPIARNQIVLADALRGVLGWR